MIDVFLYLRQDILLIPEKLYITLQGFALCGKGPGVCIQIDAAFISAVFCLLHQIDCGRITVKGKQNGLPAFKNLIGNAFI